MSKKKEEETSPQGQVDLNSLVQVMAQAISQAVVKSQQPVVSDEWSVVEAPVKEEITEEEGESLKSLVSRPSGDLSSKKKLLGFTTGTFLDELFLSEDDVTPLGGVPICSQVGITGLPGSGKTLLSMEIALKVANNGKKVLYVTSEDVFASDTPRFDLQSRLMRKAQQLKLNWKKISDNLYVMDAANYSELREWSKFIRTYRYACESNGIDFAIIDSITLLETMRGALKYRVSEIARYNQKEGITALYVNQRAAEDVDVFAMAGGITLAHTYDAIVIIDYCYAYAQGLLAELKKFEVKRGEFVRFSRVLDCALCGYVRDYLLVDIDKNGFLRPSTERRARVAVPQEKEEE